MSDPDDQEDGVQQRLVSAADSSPLHSAAASSVFNWRGAGSAAAAAPTPPAAEEPQEQEETMVTTKKRAARGAQKDALPPQVQICMALRAGGDLTRNALAEHCSDLTSAQISQALHYMAAKDRVQVVKVAVDGRIVKTFRLTKAGTAWLQAATDGEAPVEKEPARKKSAGRGRAHARKPRKPKAEEVDTSPAEDDETTFRCAVLSDGAFFLTKDGTTIELDADEHAQMLHYLERMAEPA
ncbi:MAG: hypothetical protein K0R58_24 [Ramlibacter sp.]|jgi:DNA-binding PadR family transcriptional regulator|nr:hypothetical protein [Ramlibacter sp.]